MEAVWNEREKGRDDYLYEMSNNQQAYYQAWYMGNRRPIVTKRYEDPDAVFDTYAYPRGAAVLNMLRFVLGDPRAAPALEELLKNIPPGIPEGIAKQFVGGLINQLKNKKPSDNKD